MFDEIDMGDNPTYARIIRAGVLMFMLLVSSFFMYGCDGVFWRQDPEKNMTRILGQRAWITVTQDGGRELLIRKSLPVHRSDTVLDLLSAVADVRLAPNGAIAQVNGLGGGALRAFGPEQAGWFYRVDGIEGNIRPDRLRVKPGQSVWWDLRRTDIFETIPVAVGEFPQPLFSGWRNSARPLRIAYGSGFKDDANYIRNSIFSELNPNVVSIKGDTGIVGVGGEDSRGDKDLGGTVAVRRNRANLVIARWEDARLDPFIIDIGTDPKGYGLTVWIEGTDIMRQDPDMEFSERLPFAEGIIWATTVDAEPDGAIVMLVSGTTKDGVRGALRALRSGSCQFYIACAVTRDGDVVR